MTTTTREATVNTTIRIADIADELVAGRSFPHRDALAPQNAATAVALIRARRDFWLAAAAGYVAQAQAGCTDARQDAAEAFAQANRYAA